MDASPPNARFAVDLPSFLREVMSAGGNLALPISRAEALQVPAVQRARNLICGPLATLPIRVHRPDRTIDAGPWLVPNPDPELAQSVMMAMTYEDLLFEGVSWWRVTRFGPGGPGRGFPLEARHVPHSSVMVQPPGGLLPSQQRILPDQPFPVDGAVYIDGIFVPDVEIIRFDSPNPPLLRHAARAIRICLLLEQTAALYADETMPLGYFTLPEGVPEPDDTEIQKALDKWEIARKQRAWGFVPKSLQPNLVQWNPEQLQLASQRQHAVLEIARAAGLDSEELGVSTTSRTYANETDRDQAKLKYTYGPYVSAVQDRLSMRDVLRPGYVSLIDFSGFLRASEKTRMDTYKVGLEVGAYADEDEVRENEYKPRLTPVQKSARSAKPATPPPANQEAKRERPLKVVENFENADSIRVTFDGSADSLFQVNRQSRTVTGLILPWNKVADNGFAKWRFAKGSVELPDIIGRVKLNMHHDRTDLIGKATRIQPGNAGLIGTFQVAKDADGDRALARADEGILDGFSVEVEFGGPDSWEIDPEDPNVRLVTQARLTGVALTGTPAFDDARLTDVKATRGQPQEGREMAGNATAIGQPETQPQFDFDGFVTGLTESMKETHENLTKHLTESLGESFSAAMKVALEGITAPQDGPQPVRAARYVVTREAPIYALNGAGPSLVRDGWYACQHRDADAMDRLRKFRMQTDDLAKLANSELQRQRFTTITTGNASQVIPPGYRPDLFVPMLAQGRPMVNALSRGVIDNATPFVVPIFTSVTAATADHVEGTNPTDGTLTLGTKTVTPGAISGSLVLTREIVDSSNPAIDQIALNAMMESYNQQTEVKVYSLLNGANGAGGVITNGFVPSGAQAATFAGTGGAPFAEAALVKGLRQQLAKYPFARFASPGAGLLGQNATSLIAGAMDSTGRPIFPSIGAQNASGLGNAISQGWSVDGLPFVPAWAMTGVAAGDSQIMFMNQLDGWAWESPLLTFRYEEKQGPAKIELDLFGYFATHLLRPRGLSGVRIT